MESTVAIDVRPGVGNLGTESRRDNIDLRGYNWSHINCIRVLRKSSPYVTYYTRCFVHFFAKRPSKEAEGWWSGDYPAQYTSSRPRLGEKRCGHVTDLDRPIYELAGSYLTHWCTHHGHLRDTRQCIPCFSGSNIPRNISHWEIASRDAMFQGDNAMNKCAWAIMKTWHRDQVFVTNNPSYLTISCMEFMDAHTRNGAQA